MNRPHPLFKGLEGLQPEPINYWVAAGIYFHPYGLWLLVCYQPPLQRLGSGSHRTKNRQEAARGRARYYGYHLLPDASMRPLALSGLFSASGYVVATKNQTPEVIQAIRSGTGLIPTVILVVGIFLLAILGT